MTITKVLSVASEHGGGMTLVSYNGDQYTCPSFIGFGLYSVQVGDEFLATLNVVNRGEADEPSEPIARTTSKSWEILVALDPIEQEESTHEDSFELLVFLPNRTSGQAPNKWCHFKGPLCSRTKQTAQGLMMVIETPLLSEIERLRSEIQNQPWAKDVAGVMVRRVTKITRWFAVRPDQLAQAVRPEGRITYFAGSDDA